MRGATQPCPASRIAQVYEETAGLTVGDVVTRTKKVRAGRRHDLLSCWPGEGQPQQPWALLRCQGGHAPRARMALDPVWPPTNRQAGRAGCKRRQQHLHGRPTGSCCAALSALGRQMAQAHQLSGGSSTPSPVAGRCAWGGAVEHHRPCPSPAAAAVRGAGPRPPGQHLRRHPAPAEADRPAERGCVHPARRERPRPRPQQNVGVPAHHLQGARAPPGMRPGADRGACGQQRASGVRDILSPGSCWGGDPGWRTPPPPPSLRCAPPAPPRLPVRGRWATASQPATSTPP